MNVTDGRHLAQVIIQAFDHYSARVHDLTIVSATATATASNAADAPVVGTTSTVVDLTSGTATFDDLILAAKPGHHLLNFALRFPSGTLREVLHVQVLPCSPGKNLRKGAVGYSCMECPAGKANPVVGGTCEDCVAGKFSDSGNVTSCGACQPGSFSEPGATVCKASRVNGNLPAVSRIIVNKISDHMLSCLYELPLNVNHADYAFVAEASTTRDFATSLSAQVFEVNQTVIVVTKAPVHVAPVYFQMYLQSRRESGQRGPRTKLLEGYNVTSSCSDEQYLNDSAAATQDWTCDACPVGAKCAGNIRYNGVRGKFGYWRVPGAAPQVFHKCLFPAACLGAANEAEFGKYFNSTWHDSSTDIARMDFTEQCYEPWGYAHDCGGGRCRLCTSCLQGYKRTGRARCKICPEQGANRALLATGILAVILGAVGIIVLTIHAGAGVVTVSEATKKILLNYLQVVSMAALFPMQWPEEVENFFAVQSAISSASKALLSPDCELSWMVPAEAFYQKQIGFALLPLLIVAACSSVWYLARVFRCSCGAGPRFCMRLLNDPAPPNFYYNRAVLSIVVLLYMAFPTIVKQGLAMFSCEQVGDEFWLAADLQEPCMESRHLVFALTLGLPQMLLYMIGLPLTAIIILYRNRKHLLDQNMQFRFGLLYAGFRHEVYWWELSFVVRKVALILVGATFAVRLKPDMQVYIALALLVFFIILQLGMRPFDELTEKHHILNFLELGSLVICWSTLYCGMLFWMGDRLPHSFQVFLSIFVLTTNTFFSAYLIFVFVRAFRRESVNDSPQSAENLRKFFIRRRSINTAKSNDSVKSSSPSELNICIAMSVINPLEKSSDVPVNRMRL